MIDAQIDPVSLAKIEANLKLVATDIADRINWAVLDEVTDPVVDLTRDLCPEGDPAKDIFSGLLKKSVGKRVIKRKGQGTVVIGPRRNMGVETGHSQGKSTGTGTMKIPTRYAHWQEFGTSKQAPKPFMRPAWDIEGGQTLLDRYMQSFEKKLYSAVANMGP